MTAAYRDPIPTPVPVWYVLTEPSEFRAHDSRLRGPFNKDTAHNFARRWVAVNRFGQATIGRVSAWPPLLNWTPEPRDDDGTDKAYRE